MQTKLFAALLLLVVMPSRADDMFLGGVISGGNVVGEHSGSYVDVTGYAGLALWVMLLTQALGTPVCYKHTSA